MTQNRNNGSLAHMDGIFFLLIAAGAFIGIIVGIFIGLITHNWSCEGTSWACLAVFGLLGGALTSPPTPPVRYCPRCGTRHSLPLGPNCRR